MARVLRKRRPNTRRMLVNPKRKYTSRPTQKPTKKGMQMTDRGRGCKRKPQSDFQGATGKRRYNLRSSNSLMLVEEVPCCSKEDRTRYALLGLDTALVNRLTTHAYSRFCANSSPAKRKHSHISVISISSGDDEESMVRTAEWVATIVLPTSDAVGTEEAFIGDTVPTSSKTESDQVNEAEILRYQMSLPQIPSSYMREFEPLSKSTPEKVQTQSVAPEEPQTRAEPSILLSSEPPDYSSYAERGETTKNTILNPIQTTQPPDESLTVHYQQSLFNNRLTPSSVDTYKINCTGLFDGFDKKENSLNLENGNREGFYFGPQSPNTTGVSTNYSQLVSQENNFLSTTTNSFMSGIMRFPNICLDSSPDQSHVQKLDDLETRLNDLPSTLTDVQTGATSSGQHPRDNYSQTDDNNKITRNTTD